MSLIKRERLHDNSRGSRDDCKRLDESIVLAQCGSHDTTLHSVHGHECLSPIRAVERAVLNRFAEMSWGDCVGGFEVGDAARDFQDAVVGAGG